jgi:hypothetical protein
LRIIHLAYFLVPFLTFGQDSLQTKKLEDALSCKGYRWFKIEAFNHELHSIHFVSNPEYAPNYIRYGYSPDNGESWQFENIEEREGKVNYVGSVSIAPFNASIAIDPCGDPHILYQVNYFYNYTGPSYLIHAYKKLGNWVKDTVISRTKDQPMIAFQNDIQIGSDGIIRLSYLTEKEALWYAKKVGNRWHHEKLFENNQFNNTRIALDVYNKPVILAGSMSDGLIIFEKNGRDWIYTGVPSSSGWMGDIAVDRNNDIHIIHSNSMEHQFLHKLRKGNRWIANTIEPSGGRNAGNTLQSDFLIDKNGIIHACFYRHTDEYSKQSLTYAQSKTNGRTWHLKVIQSTPNTFAETSYPGITINTRGIHFFYKNEKDSLYYAQIYHKHPEFEKEVSEDCLPRPELPGPPKNPLANYKRKLDIQHELNIENKEIIISIWDNAIFDGDQISIYYNDSLIVNNHLLLKNKRHIKISIPKNEIVTLIFHAENEGNLPPNTSSVQITDGDKVHTLVMRSSKNESGAIQLNRP